LEPTEEEVKAGLGPDGMEETVEEGEEQQVKGINEFWLTAMKNMVSLADIIMEDDEDALKHLVDVRLEFMDRLGFKLVFEFSENEYFTNKILTKSYIYRETVGYEGDFIYDHAEGDTIDWKPNKDLTHKLEEKKQRNRKTGQTRIVKKVVPQDSFFYFFSPPVAPAEDAAEEGDEAGDEDEEDDINERLEVDYQLGEDFKEKLIPKAVDWFTGRALQYEVMDDDLLGGDDYEDDDDDELEDLDDDEDPEDEDESDDETRPGKQEPSECKQS